MRFEIGADAIVVPRAYEDWARRCGGAGAVVADGEPAGVVVAGLYELGGTWRPVRLRRGGDTPNSLSVQVREKITFTKMPNVNRGILTWMARAVSMALSLFALGYVAYQAALSASTLGHASFSPGNYVSVIPGSVGDLSGSRDGHRFSGMSWSRVQDRRISASAIRFVFSVAAKSSNTFRPTSCTMPAATLPRIAWESPHKALIWASVAEGALVLAAAALTTCDLCAPAFRKGTRCA